MFVARWLIDDIEYEQADKIGFKTLLLNLLDTLIQYRFRCGVHPWKDGVVEIKNGQLEINLLEAGVTTLSQQKESTNEPTI